MVAERLFGTVDDNLDGLGGVLAELAEPRPRRRGPHSCASVRSHDARHVGVLATVSAAALTRSAPRRPHRRQALRHPHLACDACGSRVLELLYCYSCGDVSLGGFVVDRANPDAGEGEGVVIGSANVGVVSAEAPPVFQAAARRVRLVLAGRQAHRGRPVVDQDDARVEEDRRLLVRSSTA